MSMFRRPGDSSPSSSDVSNEDTENEATDPLHQDSVLTRINSLDMPSSGAPAEGDRPRRERQTPAEDVRDLILHSLLEERTINQVASELGRDASDPDVQRIGREAYQQIARQLAHNVDGRYAESDMQGHRATANAGINRLTRDNLSRLAVAPGATSQALVAQPANSLAIEVPQQPVPGFDMLSGISVPTELQLSGYPGLQVDRYMREFSELDVVGKGGYGKVYKAKHKLDGSLYAVKRIPISPAKQARIQEHGPQELESMLEEVRSLARFEHANIVRYFNAWLEFTSVPPAMSGVAIPVLRADRLLQEHATFPYGSPEFNSLHSHLDSLSFGEVRASTDVSAGAGIVFGYSNSEDRAEDARSDGHGPSLQEKLRASKDKRRRGSQATIATISSTKSRLSVVEDVDEEEDEEEDEIEMISRSHSPQHTSDESESMISNSDAPGHMISTSSHGPVLTLNVQMSLCETNLAAFLSSERSTGTGVIDEHCFHACISLELLNGIVSGVDYLHAQGVVHRDLKPANVFLSLSTARRAPYGSVDVSGCKPCGERPCVHITPRIGDFGLVAALDTGPAATNVYAKPVGTEMYRPATNHGVSEKLDVFALGIIAFEMLQKFGTRMERIATLTDLRGGVFPNTFALGLGLGDVGEKVQQLVGNMVDADEKGRMSSSEVKDEIGRLVDMLKL